MKVCCLILLLIYPSALVAESLPEKYSALGELILTPFGTAPFPHPSRTNGYQYREEFFPADRHYADSTVALFVPKGLQETGRVDFVIHFHGWRNTVAGTLQNYQLIEQLGACGKQAVLVIPEGPHNAPDSSGGKLEEAEGFQRFMAEVLAVLQQRHMIKTNSTSGNIILSGHSGGYRVISSIVERGGLTAQVKEVWLFDALYGQPDKFLAWADQTNGRFITIYTDGGGTKTQTEAMMAQLKNRGTKILATTDQAVSLQELKTNKFIFLHTGLSHNEVVAGRKTFQQFLESSCLEKRTTIRPPD